MKSLPALLLLASFALPSSAAEPDASELTAWYHRADAGLHSSGGTISAWDNSPDSPAKNLTRTVGSPRIWRVQTPGGIKEVVRLDGHSAIWQTAASWGTLESPRTIIAFARIPEGTKGVLCDGSTRAATDPIRPDSTRPGWHTWRFTRTAGKLGGLILGADVATHNNLPCDLAEIMIFPRELTDSEFQSHAEYLEKKWGTPTDLPDSQQILPPAPFAGLTTKILRKNGEDGVHTYRIPGIATSTKGTLLAVFDLRHDSAVDLPGNIDVGLMRSTDDGETWSPVQRILDYPDSGVGDPTILVDRVTGSIFVAALWSQGNRAWNGSGPGMTPEETGQFVLTRSDDDGATWSAPFSITLQIKKPEWRLCFNGPGAGIQTKDGTLVIPAQFRDPKGTPHSCFIASKDHGKSWTISPPCHPHTSEAQIAEVSGGGLLLTMRDESRSGQRLWAQFYGARWGDPWRALPDPTCQASLLRLPDGSLLFANPAHPKSRTSLTVRTSLDEGKSWSDGRIIDPHTSMYSSMTAMGDGRIALLYEGAPGLVLARFSPENANLAAVPEGRFETSGKFAWWPARHAQKRAEPKAHVPLVFLGDSITQSWETTGADTWKKHFAPRNAANYGFAGDSTQHVLWRIHHGELDGLDPKVIVLQIGTNNAKQGDFSPAQIAGGISAILEKLAEKCPRSQILLLAIFPRDARPEDEMRRKCEETNALLPALADGKRVHFLDINPAFLQPDGTLTTEVAPDLLHLSAKGYALWANALLPKLTSFLPPQ